MRMLILSLGLVACNEHGKSPALGDASTIDVNTQSCTAAAGTANVQVMGTAPAQFVRLDAGGLWLTGPVTGVAGAPMQFTLLYTNTDPLDSNAAGCCASSDASCCKVAGLVLQTEAIPDGGEVGDHPATVKSFTDPSFSISGTLTITKFAHPFEMAPGRIAGSVSAIANTRTVSGSFDNSFCQILLSATI
jgi:hypothetical protein